MLLSSSVPLVLSLLCLSNPVIAWTGNYTNASATCASTANWPGWDKLKYAFVFGDSYTSTSFNLSLDPPTPSSPLGNPAYPGWTSSNGPNWVDYLTVKYNESLLLTYNLAFGGATVSASLVKPWREDVLSLRDQVEDEFLPFYSFPLVNDSDVLGGTTPSWTPSDTLFAIWIGINDVGNTYYLTPDSLSSLNSKIFALYSGLLDTLYQTGARNFLFLTVPPVDRSPLTAAQGSAAEGSEKEGIAVFNAKIEALAKAVKANWKDVNVFVVDANAVFTKVLDDPSSFAQTAGLKNLTDYCVAYENGTPSPTTYDPTCGVAVNEYFWLNSLHPTYPMHDALAEVVAETLEAGPNVC